MTQALNALDAYCAARRRSLPFFSASSWRAQAQTYPDKPIKIIVPSAPGGPTDVPARLASQILPPRSASRS